MEIYPELLFRLLLASLLFGAGIGVLYDLIRIQRVMLGMSRYTAAASAPVFCPKFAIPKIRKAPRKISRVLKHALLIAQDLFFCVTVGILLSVLLFYRNNGEFRGFVLVGVLLGFAVYYFTVGRLVIHASEYVVFALKTAVLYAVYYVSFPFIAAGRFLITKISRLVRRCRDRRYEKVVRRYHLAKSRELLTAAQDGFLEKGWEANEKSH